ncbi:MAG: hypothetical protein GXO66_06955 [Euryarchaeota archaeon]|nr:hypothetical protein [Euryarchaeota archaeon]
MTSEIVLDPEIKLMMVEKSIGMLATREELKEIRDELKGDIASLRKELKGEIAEVRKDMRAMLQIGFTAIGLLIAILGLFLGYLIRA